MLLKDKFFPIITVILGACLEYYNYMLFTFMIKYDGFLLEFFPCNNHGNAILHGYMFLLATALIRPFGALLFGWIGDKYGRKIALFWSLILMSFSSFLFTLAPTYQHIGQFCLVFLFFCRVMQIVSASGESNGAAIFLIEHVGASRSGLASGIAFSSTMLGATLATYAASLISSIGSSWRYAFLIGGFVSSIGMIIRFKTSETHHQHKNKRSSHNTQDTWSLYTSIILVSAATSAGFYYIAVFLSGHWQNMLSINIPSITQLHKINYINTDIVLLYTILLLFSGLLSDYISLFKLMQTGATGMLIIIPITYYQITNTPTSSFITAMLCLTVLFLSMLSGPLHSFLYRFFPANRRYKYVSLCYSIAASTIGTGTVPISGYLAQYNIHFGWIWIWIVFAAALISLFITEKIWNQNKHLSNM